MCRILVQSPLDVQRNGVGKKRGTKQFSRGIPSFIFSCCCCCCMYVLRARVCVFTRWIFKRCSPMQIELNTRRKRIIRRPPPPKKKSLERESLYNHHAHFGPFSKSFVLHSPPIFLFFYILKRFFFSPLLKEKVIRPKMVSPWLDLVSALTNTENGFWWFLGW